MWFVHAMLSVHAMGYVHAMVTAVVFITERTGIRINLIPNADDRHIVYQSAIYAKQKRHREI